MEPILNLALIEQGLRLEGDQRFEEQPWLEESRHHRKAFWRDMKRSLDELYGFHGASTLFSTYDFYHDITQRNRANPVPAISWVDSDGGLREISYAELGRAADIKAARWARQGLVPGQTVCLVRFEGVELASDLLAGLKSGAVISLLPPWGRHFLQARLEQLQPDYITAEPASYPLLNAWMDSVLSDEAEGMPPVPQFFHGYPAGDPVFRLFPRGSSASLVPVDISSEAAYLSALRDGLISLGLRPGKVYAAPGFHLLETQPALLLVGLLCGASWCHLRPGDLVSDAGLMDGRPITAFGVSCRVREMLLDTSYPLDGRWESWFRNPAESFDLDRWQLFVRRLHLDRSFAFNLRWDAALGGCSLVSARRQGTAHMMVLPPAGCGWSLGAPGLQNPMPGGALSLSLPGAPEDLMHPAGSMLTSHRHEWLFTGVDGVSRHGAVYPVDELLTVLRDGFASVDLFFSIVACPRSDRPDGCCLVLLVFTGLGPEAHPPTLEEDSRALIAREMGDEFQPDTVVSVPLIPRLLSDRKVDHAWCRDQYLSGFLAKRAQGEVFRCLTALRAFLMQG
ncbi:hypothetical protein [Desulfoluna sp.]|uniref:hypothetical protein n=1 Tax=Desulfoluna sp. TaxID=2045199 RepID=UPI0026335681|nr:hypothetical protein [Desulfoluna sp.]